MRLRHAEKWIMRRLRCVLCQRASERRVCDVCLHVRRER